MSERERIILVTAATEEKVNHARIKEMSAEHPKDISATLAHLVLEGMLVKQGETRGSTYTLPAKQPAEMPLFVSNSGENSPHKAGNSPHKAGNSPHMQARLLEILASLGYASMPGRLKPALMQKIILGLCASEALSIGALSSALRRAPTALRERYLAPMSEEGLIELKYPGVKNHPNQAYRSKIR